MDANNSSKKVLNVIMLSKTKKTALTVIGIIIAIYILAPFYLGVTNIFKPNNSIVANPVSPAGMSFKQLATNLSNVINNSNFNFWYAFGTSLFITVVSLVLLAVLGVMAAVLPWHHLPSFETCYYDCNHLKCYVDLE